MYPLGGLAHLLPFGVEQKSNGHSVGILAQLTTDELSTAQHIGPLILKTSPYEFYQYWRNVGDGDVLKCIRMLTFLPLEQIEEMDKWEGSS